MKKEEASEEKLEQLRLKVKRQNCIQIVLLIIVAIYYFAEKAFDWRGPASWFMFAIVFAFVLIVNYRRKKVWEPELQDVTGDFKNTYVIPLLSGIAGFSDLSYDSKSGISWDEIRNVGVVDCAEKERYSSPDLLKGRFRGVWFAMSNVTTKQQVMHRLTVSDKIIFTGWVISFFLPETFPTCRGRIQIFQKRTWKDISGQLLEYEIKTGDEQFDQKFAVYSEYEDTPGMILTPEMCERIRRFSQAVRTQIAVAFWDRYVYIAVYGKQQFAVDCYTPVAQQKERFLEDAKLLSLAERILLEGEKIGS